MSRIAPHLTRVTLLTSLSLLACSGGPTNGATTNSPEASSSAGSAAASSGGTTGPLTSGGSGTASGGTVTGNSGGTSTGTPGTTGTTTGLPPVFIDGGYVACALASAPDAGPNGDGGPAYWNCTPGTYFCDQLGNLGSCSQCRSDSDCANQNLPTHDPLKLHCDTTSGVPGYQGFCQQCLADTDCTGNTNGNFCDVSPTFPPNSVQPAIETLGFETCNRLVTDCRIDGGPVCGGINQYCDSQSGHCLTKSGACQHDEDCVGYLSPYNANQPEPYCSDGGCNSCQGGICPSGYCTTDAQCANGTICNLATYTCACSDSSQCAGLWPVCLNFQTYDGGDVLGQCSCDDSNECSDSSLTCISSLFGPAFCGVPCTSPEFPPSCEAASSFYPVCNPAKGTCGQCTNDNQCRTANDPSGPRCDLEVGGFGSCGCNPLQNDCPAGETCVPGTYLGTCTGTLSRCTPGTCGASFCNWDSGSCLTGGTGVSLCITDFDCSIAAYYGASCTGGKCIQCQSNADCLNSGLAALGESLCCLPGVSACEGAVSYPDNTCVDSCSHDADCTGNYFGGSCITADGGFPRCGCGSDKDCASSPYGTHCDRDPSDSFFGYCNCQSNGDCAVGQSCQIFAGATTGYCGGSCYTLDGGACPDDYFCDPTSHCRPRCDTGNQCQGTDSVCDTLNVAGQNNALYGEDAGGISWCYSCVQPSDCPAGQGCDPIAGCNHCSSDAQCPTGTACIDGGICQPECVGGACPSGQVCDIHGLAGYGSDICYQCLSAEDCPSPEGCNGATHTCGTCFGPAAANAAGDCPPDAVCSNYWSSTFPGVCLANCDRTPCPASEPICALYPGLTPDHQYCFACLKDSDCAANQRCNLSPHPTFTCVPKP